MATTTPNFHDALVKAGVDEEAATAMAARLERRAGPSAMSILIAATLAGFGLLAIGIGWVKSDIGELRLRIDAVNERVGENAERLTRIETLLEERLPPRR